MIKALKITTSIIALAVSVNAASTHCTSSENVLFSCNTGKKTVSVCASKNIGPKTGYIQYRFGKIGNPEALIPSKPEQFRSTVSSGLYYGTAGSITEMTFKNADFSYIITSIDGRDYMNTGLTVKKKDKFIADLTCRQNSDMISNIDDPDELKKLGIKVENNRPW